MDNALLALYSSKAKRAQLAREMNHGWDGSVPTQQQAQHGVDLAVRDMYTPHDIAYGEEPLSAPSIANGLISLDPTDYIGPNALAKLAIGAKGALTGIPAMVGMVASKGITKKTEFELAHELAQRNAALPVEQGGLGLLADNTAMDRAKAMGFDIPAYHGTRADEINAFDPLKAEFSREGAGTWFSENPEIANSYAGNNGGSVIPVMVRSKNLGELDASNRNWSNLHDDSVIRHANGTDSALFEYNDNFGSGLTTNDVARIAKRNGDSGLRVLNVSDRGGHGRGVGKLPDYADNLTVFAPSQVRSRFAAFDPMKRNSANLLAGGAATVVTLPEIMQYLQARDNSQ